jgi:hypothetical protein
MSTIAGKRALRWPQPLNVFALPPDLLDQLTVRNLHVQPHPAPFSSVSTTATANDDTTGPPISSNTSSDTLSFSTTTAQADRASGGLSCGICPGAFFEDVEEQRAHFKDDWHRYNVRAKMTAASVGGGPEGVQRKVKKGTPLSLEDFESMVDGSSLVSWVSLMVPCFAWSNTARREALSDFPLPNCLARACRAWDGRLTSPLSRVNARPLFDLWLRIRRVEHVDDRSRPGDEPPSQTTSRWAVLPSSSF